jgi:hypothetical protein
LHHPTHDPIKKVGILMSDTWILVTLYTMLALTMWVILATFLGLIIGGVVVERDRGDRTPDEYRNRQIED